MKSNHGFIYALLRMLFYPWISRVRLLQAELDELRRLEEEGQLIFVGNAASVIDFMIVNDQLERNGLKPLSFSHGFGHFLLYPFREAFSRWTTRLFKGTDDRERMELDELVSQTARGGNGYVFLKRAPRLLNTRIHYYHGYFGKLAVAKAQREQKIFLVPTTVFLTRNRKLGQPRTLRDVFFGTYDIPGRPRKLYQLTFNYHKGGTIFSKHIDLEAELAKATPEQAAEAKADKRLRLTLLFHLNKEDRAYRGGNKRSRGRKVQRILKEKRLRKELNAVAERTGRTPENVMKEAEKTLMDIASDTSERIINLARILFDFVFSRTLEGLDFRQEELDQMRALNKSGPVILLPCHRSHVDYLVTAYLFEKQGLNYPRIAAGDNLSKWPLGAILRGCGAFFLRRSFKGEVIFPLVFDAYIRHVLRERHNIIFFTEGGRSRTGKLLHPKMGMMSMIVDAWRQGVVDDLPLVPVTIDYGKVFEGGAYLREKSGLAKKKEDIGAVIASRKVLSKKHGVLRLRFGDPIWLKDFVEGQGFTQDTLGFKNKIPVINKLSYHVVNQINSRVTLTAGNVVAGLLMGNPRRGMTMEDLKALFVITVRYLRRRGVEITFSDQKLDEALENALATFEEWETLVRVEVGGKVVVNIPDDKRSEMEYYKNNGFHYVLEQALFNTAFICVSSDQRTLPEIAAQAREIYHFLNGEFLFTGEWPTDAQMEEAYNDMARIDAYTMVEGRVRWGNRRMGTELVRISGGMVTSLLESYFVVAEVLSDLTPESEIDRKQFLKQCLTRAKLLHAVGILSRAESVNHLSFGNALKRYNKYGFVQLKNLKGQKHPKLIFNEKKRELFNETKDNVFKWMQHLT